MERGTDTMGKSEVFDKAIAAFGKTYADQTEGDHAAFNKAIRQSRIGVQRETRDSASLPRKGAMDNQPK